MAPAEGPEKCGPRRPTRSGYSCNNAGVSLAKYGFERTCASPLHEGDVIQYRITNHDGQVFAFENYYLAPGTYETAAHRAGFDDFRWVDAMLEPTERDDPYWDDFLTHAPLTAFCASKR